ncbi:hypothetical protein HW555_013870, partial [Spodoptera exigua]
VALVLALIGMVVANPVPPLGLGLASPVLLPSYSVSSSLINHGVTIPVVSAPVVRHVVSAPLSPLPSSALLSSLLPSVWAGAASAGARPSAGGPATAGALAGAKDGIKQ